jgi:pyruvate dehydrogenase E2 component (dihydrolipoamide acetyltransferase)
MRRELLMPKLGLTMTEGALVEWMAAPGQAFKAGAGLFVIESEKAAIEIPAEASGVMLETTAEPGATLAVGAVMGYWEDGVPADETPAPAEPAQAAARVSTVVRIPVTPLARRLAEQRGIDLAQVRGSGPRGRIRARDLPDAASPAPHIVAEAAATGASRGSLRRPSSTEQTVARRLTAAKQDVPHFYLAVEAEVTALQALRAELNAAQAGLRFTLNHFIVAAVGRALAGMPEVNRVWTGEGILELDSSDVGVAVHTGRGLMVPVLRDVGRQPLSAVARSAAAAIDRAQAGRLGADEMAGGAITVSNAGMHDVSYMTSIINPGQSMILGVGSVRQLFRPDDAGQPALRREMGMVLSADHRVLDGVAALQFLKRVVGALEQPLALLVA